MITPLSTQMSASILKNLSQIELKNCGVWPESDVSDKHDIFCGAGLKHHSTAENHFCENIAKGRKHPRVDSCDKNMPICSLSPSSSPLKFNVQSSLLYSSSRSSKSHGFPYLGLLDESVCLAPVVRLSQLILKSF